MQPRVKPLNQRRGAILASGTEVGSYLGGRSWRFSGRDWQSPVLRNSWPDSAPGMHGAPRAHSSGGLSGPGTVINRRYAGSDSGSSMKLVR